MTTPFSQQIKEGTKKSHNAAENTRFVSQFLKGVVSRDNYSKLTSNFYFIYRAMEEEIDKLVPTNQCIGMIYNKSLKRQTELEKDLQYFYGDQWKNRINPSPATQTYVNRIREVATTTPELLVAHHYTRYMGDLSGGQILKQIAKTALTLDDIPGNGLNFYDFPLNPTNAKIQYRAILDELPLTFNQQQDIIKEANNAFALNMYMFDELHGNPIKSLLKLIINKFKS